MRFNRIALLVVFALSLACNTVSQSFSPATPTSVLAPVLPPTTPTTVASAPLYIPPECQNVPLATVPPATALAQPTPYLQANPEVSHDLQIQVFNEMVNTIEDVYVYEDFNGVDWNALVSRHREQIDAGLSTEVFYAELQSMIIELGDEHSWLESPVEVAEAEAELAGTNDFVGIGVFYLPLIEKGHATILTVFPDSPAQHSGIKPHDSILAVDGQPAIRNGEDVTYLVTGPECSAVVLTIQTPGQEPRDLTLVRRRIQGPTPIEATLLPTSDGSRVGYVFLPSFYDETIPGRVADALESFGTLDGLIIDNRMNGGGSSSVLEPILSYFVSGALGEYTSRSDSRLMQIEANPIQNSQTVPMVVLVSEDTVSFGEVFSGVLKDAGRAQIVGEPTLGNVEVLHGYSFSDGSRLWIAEETFTPTNSQANWEETGIIPDVIAYQDWDTFTFENDPSIAAALTLLGH